MNWSDGNTYKATVLSMGKRVSHIILLYLLPFRNYIVCVNFMYVGNEKEMRKAERNLLNPGCGDSENFTHKKRREENSENGPASKKARHRRT